MATIVILEHLMQRDIGIPYMAHALAARWRETGHEVLVHHGPDRAPPGDLAILHVDLTRVPDGYLPLLGHYPRVINGPVLDTGKPRFSQHLLARDSPWRGEVIVKTAANAGGRGEQALHQRALAAGVASDVADTPVMSGYPIYPRLADVPDSLWAMPGLVFERFLPEREGESYYLRTWSFLGDRELNGRWRALEPIVKAEAFLDREEVPVPDEMRAWRARLGFDFGRFDYVRHGNEWVLLDINRTPTFPDKVTAAVSASIAHLADGLDAFLR